MNKKMLAVACGFLSAACFGSILNGSFENDGLGGTLDWGFGRTSGKVRVAHLSDRAPDGGRAVRVTGGPGEFVFRHLPLRLVAGEPYRLSAWVRTKGLSAVRRKDFEIYNSGWSKTAFADIPGDTSGEWKKIEWTGEMFASDNNVWQCVFYFCAFPADGFIDIASPALEPLSDKAKADSAAVAPFSKPFAPRILPIDPLISQVDATHARMTFYYPNELSGDCSNYELVCRIDRSQTASAPLGADARGTVEFGALEPGRHSLEVTLQEKGSKTVVARNEYSIRARVPRTMPSGSRRLNNFVTELFTVPLADDHYDFVNPRDGWVFVGFDRPYRGVTAHMDHSASPAVKFREHEPSETMRFLSAGSHTVTVRGAAENGIRDGRLTVRLVKPIVHSGGRLYRQKTNVAAYTWGPEFYRRFQYHFFNETTSEAKRYQKAGKPIPQWILDIDADLADRGIRKLNMFGISPDDPDRSDLSKLLPRMAGYRKSADGFGYSIDENSVGASRLMHYNWGEACWRLWNPVQSIDVFFNDATRSMFVDPIGHTMELSATLNAGDGLSRLSPEVYLRVPETEADALAQEDYYLRWAGSARACVPSAPAHVVYYLGGWLTNGQWCPYYCPEGDIKYLYDHFLHRLATDPKFADVGGAGFSNPSCDESFFRWTAKLLHYYCVEGGTEPLSAKYGLRYRPELVRNGDFLDGFDGWTASAAEGDSLKTDQIRKFGSGPMRRLLQYSGKSARRPWGDSFALFTRSAKAPNVLRQKIAGLEKGRTYEFMFCTVDYENATKKTKPPEDFTFVARVEGADEIPSLAYRHLSQMLGMDRKAGRFLPTIVTHRLVFRATGPEAEIVFSDWKDAAEPGGRVGERRMLNYVAMWPYYEGDPGDLEALGKMLDEQGHMW